VAAEHRDCAVAGNAGAADPPIGTLWVGDSERSAQVRRRRPLRTTPLRLCVIYFALVDSVIAILSRLLLKTFPDFFAFLSAVAHRVPFIILSPCDSAPAIIPRRDSQATRQRNIGGPACVKCLAQD
jgi:hypothetical protein